MERHGGDLFNGYWIWCITIIVASTLIAWGGINSRTHKKQIKELKQELKELRKRKE